MIIKHSPLRKTPDLYSEQLYAEICDSLGIQDNQQKAYFKETIERAAISLIESNRRNKQRFTDGEEKDELLRLAKSLEKSRNIFDGICDRSQMGQFRLFSPIKFKPSENEKLIKDALKEVFGDFHSTPQAISLALLALEKLALHARENSYHFGKKNKTTLALQWLWYFSDDWEEISKVKLSEGREYDSPALRILRKMVEPINHHLPAENQITESMLEQAVIMYRQYKKEHPDEGVCSGETA